MLTSLDYLHYLSVTREFKAIQKNKWRNGMCKSDCRSVEECKCSKKKEWPCDHIVKSYNTPTPNEARWVIRTLCGGADTYVRESWDLCPFAECGAVRPDEKITPIVGHIYNIKHCDDNVMYVSCDVDKTTFICLKTGNRWNNPSSTKDVKITKHLGAFSDYYERR